MWSVNSLIFNPYNSEIFNLMTGDDILAASNLELKYIIKIGNKSFGQLGESYFVGKTFGIEFVIKNKSNNEVIIGDFMFIFNSPNDGENSAIVSINIKKATDKDFPENCDLILENLEFADLKTKIQEATDAGILCLIPYIEIVKV